MKKFEFSLRGLLNARIAQKEAAELDVRLAQQRLAAEETALRNLNGQIAALLSAPLPLERPTGNDFLLRDRYLASLKRRRKEQQTKRDQAASAVAACLKKLQRADIELKKIEKLRDREYQDWTVEFRRDEQKISDEIGMILDFYQPRQL